MQKLLGLAISAGQYVKAHVAHIMLAMLALTFLMDPGTVSAVDYDPAALVTGVGALFQTAIAAAAVIIATLIGIRVVKKALRAA